MPHDKHIPGKAYSKDIYAKISLVLEGGNYLGMGRIELMESIEAFGSLSQAAKHVKMSYKRAWDLVNQINHNQTKALIECAKGGVGGGGSHLTEHGKAQLRAYKQLETEFSKFLNQKGF